MPQISSRVALAYPAPTIWIERGVVPRIARLFDRDLSLGCKQQSVPRRSRGQDAIHHIDAEIGVFNDLLRRAHSHEVTRLVGGGMFNRGFDNFASERPRFAHAEPADR